MAKYRQVHITYWQDPFVEELEPLEKYFYLYLMTNSKTMQCGCYEISFRLMQYETGLTKDQIEAYINLFQSENKIFFDYNTKEFLIVNWLKHNSYASPKVKACINKELTNIKSKLFKQYIDGIVNNKMTIGRPLIDYTKPIDTSSQQEQEQEQEEEQQQQTEDVSKLLKMYQQDIQQMPGKTIIDSLLSYYEIFGFEMTEYCIIISAKQGATKFAYLESIFKDWLNKGYNTIDHVKTKEKPKDNKKPKFVAPWYKEGQEDEGYGQSN